MKARTRVAAVALIASLAAHSIAQEPPPVLDGVLTPPRSAIPEAGENAEAEPRREEWETDRDSFTPSVKTAGEGRWIVESAYSFLDNRRRPESHSFPELLLRYGVGRRFELRLGWNYEVGGAGNSTSGGVEGGHDPENRIERESTLSFGAKAGLLEQECLRPECALILTGFVPTSGAETATQLVVAPVAGWELPNRWRLDTALRYGTNSEEGDHFSSWAPSVVVKAPLGERWNAHAEYFGVFSRDKAKDDVLHYISPGLHCLVTPNLEVGVRLGWGLNDQSARFFANSGLGWRF